MQKTRDELFVNDLYIESFTDSDEMIAALGELEDATKWHHGIKASGIELLSIPDSETDAIFFAKSYGCDEDATLNTLTGTRLALSFDGRIIPLRDTAMKSLLERAEVTGGVIRKLSPEEMTQLLNLCLPKSNGDALVLERGRKATAVLSDNNGGYEYLPMYDLMHVTEDALFERFGTKTSFIEGEISHSFMVAKYAINDPELLKEYEALTVDSLYGGPYTPSLAIYSADVGTCSATIAASIRTPRGATIRINKELTVPHKKGATTEIFREKLKEVFTKYVDFMKVLGELTEVVVSDPAKAFMLGAAKARLPKKLAKKALEDFMMYVAEGESSTAHDIYLGLCEIIFYAKSGGANEREICRLEDLVARCLTYDWSEWEDWE